MTRKLVVWTFLVATLISPSSASAQGESEKQVLATVEALLTDLGTLNADALSDYFAPDAVLVVARQGEQGFNNTINTAEKWLDQIRSNPNPDPFEERISNVEVTLDSDQLAYLRADFEIVRKGKVVSSGVDVFTLIRNGSEWEIAVIAYTSIPTTPPR